MPTYIGSVAGVQRIVPSADATITAEILAGVTRRFQTKTGRDLFSTTYSGVVLNGNGQSKLPLPQYPVTAITSLAVSGIAIPASTGPGVYGYDHDEASLYLIGCRISRALRNVVLTYTAGYTTIPDDLTWAADKQAAAWYLEATNRLGQSSTTLQGQTNNFMQGELLPDVLATLKEYRRLTVNAR